MTVSGRTASLVTGVDIQAISSFRDHTGAVARGIRDRVFTDDERDYCESTEYPAQHYAARWAAKEAFIKLLPADHSVHYRDVEVSKDGPKPVYSLAERSAEQLCSACGVTDSESLSLSLSLSHDRDADVAVAQAVASPRGGLDG